MALSKPYSQLAILCALLLYPQVTWSREAGLLLVAIPISASSLAKVSDQAQPTLAHDVIFPGGAEVPKAWTLTPIMSPTQQWGLTLHAFQLAAPYSAVRRWVQDLTASCVVLTGEVQLDNVNSIKSPGTGMPLVERLHAQGFALPKVAPQLLWMCADATQLYSLMQWQETLLWTVSARLPNQPDESRDHFAQFLENMGAVELHTTGTAFDQVSVYQTSRTLIALHADLDVFRQRFGMQFNEHQRVHNGFLVTWQHGPSRTHVSAIRQPDGQVIITRVTGTNL